MAHWEIANRGSTQASFLKELAKYRKDPEWELFCESPEWPVYVFENKETGEMQFVGDALGIRLMTAIVEQEIAKEGKKAAKKRSKGFGK